MSKYTMLTRSILVCFSMLIIQTTLPQGVVVSDTANPALNASAIFELQSEQKGFLPPKMTTAQRTAITAPVVGLVVYDTDLQALHVFDGTDWIPSTAGSLDDAYDFGGPGAGRFINADNGPVQIGGDGGFVVDNATVSGTIPATGAGVRMMWYPGKYAFRAGRLSNSSLWSDLNIGAGSVAMGFNTWASGASATAFGRSTEASGDFSVAMGAYSEAPGENAIAMGDNAIATGDQSVALGTYVFSPSFGELSVGLFTSNYTPSSSTSFVGTDRLFVVGNGQDKVNTGNALTILKNGNTGIGISNPQALLHVDGSFRLENGTEAAGRVLTSDASGNATWAETDPLNVIIVDSAGGGDFTTITAALNNVSPTANDPVTIIINPGTYEENIVMKSYVTLEGVFSKAVKIMGDGTDVVRLDTLSCVTLKNLTIGSDGGLATNGVTIYSTDPVFENISVLGDYDTGINTMDNGIQAYNSTLTLKDCKVEELDQKGVLLDSAEVVATNCSFSASTSSLEVLAGSRLGLYDSKAGLGTYTLYILPNGMADIQGNTFNDARIYNLGKLNMTGNRIQDGTSGIALNNEGSAVVVGNTFVDCSFQAIYENSTLGSTISGNVIDNCSDLGEVAFTVNNSNAVISGNIFRNNTHGDLFVDNSSNPWLIGNQGSYASSTTAESVIAGIDDLRLERHEDDLITILPTGGNIGIGTDTPSALLHLKEGTDELKISADGINKPDASTLTISTGQDLALDPALDLEMTAGLNATLSSPLITEITGGSQVNINNQVYAVSGFGVGVNTSSTLGFTLAVNGTAAKPGGGSWSFYSDARLKKTIEPMQHGTLDRLLKLKGYTFEYKEEAIEKRLALPGRQTGLIAQEVQEVFPEWVDEDADGYLYVTERGTTALFVEALRELRAEKDAEIEDLTKKVDELSEKIHFISSQLAAD